MIDYMRPEDVPACECGDLCDRQTAMGRWYCSRCQPVVAKQRKDKTLRVLELRAKILRREGRVDDAAAGR